MTPRPPSSTLFPYTTLFRSRMMRHDSSTRVSVVLTCWPPGPDERENRQVNSFAGMTRRSSISRSRSGLPGTGLRSARGHPQGAVHADGLAVEVVVLEDHRDQTCVLIGLGETLWERDPLGETRAELLADRREHRRVDDAGCDRAHPDARRREIACRREREPDDAALRRGVRRLADLALVRRDRRGVDGDTALSVVVGLGLGNGGGGEGEDVERRSEERRVGKECRSRWWRYD